METTAVGTVSHALVLQVTLATLVANGAVKRVVGQQELHDTLTGLVDEGRVRLDDHAGLNGPGARGDGLGGALDFDQAHTTVTGDHELLVVTVAGNSGAGLFAGLNQGGTGCGRQVRRFDDTDNCLVDAYPLLRPSFHLQARVSDDELAANAIGRGVPIVSSTSAGRGAEEEKARAALREASLCERGRLRKSCWRIMLCEAGRGGCGGESRCRRLAYTVEEASSFLAIEKALL